MGALRGWVGRHQVVVAFAAGVLLTLVVVALVGYLVLADQRRSARILAATLSQSLGRGVEIDRVSDFGPSRVVLRGVRLPAALGWPADVKVDAVEASGPLLSAAKGDPAPVRVLVTRPTVVAGGGGAAGAAALEGLRQGLASFLASGALLDIAVSGGVLKTPGATPEDLTFDATLHKGSGDARGEILLRAATRARMTLGLSARADGDTVRLDLAGKGELAALAPWLPGPLAEATRTAPLDLKAQLGLSPGDRAAGRLSVRLGDAVVFESALSFQDKRLRLGEMRGTADLALAWALAGLAGPVKGRAELADGEVTWMPERGGWPEARATLHVLDATLPASAVGSDMLARNVEAKVTLEPRTDGVSARGELRGERVEVTGLPLAPVATPFRIDLDASGRPARLELTGLTAQVLGTPLRGTVAYDVPRARIDARLETSGGRLDALARRFGGDWLGPSDQLRAGAARIVVTGLDARAWSDGKVEAEIRDLALRQPAGEAAVQRARLQATARSGSVTVGYEVERVRGALSFFDGTLERVEGSADLARDAGGPRLTRATLVARDVQRREVLQADLGGPAAGSRDPVRLTARIPELERLSTLWPSVTRQVTGSATLELESPDMTFSAYQGRLSLRAPTVEMLDGRLSLRDLSADVPVRRGGAVPRAGAPVDGSLKVEEVIGYGVVLYDVTARARAIDQRVSLTDLRYGLYSGQGRGTVDLDFTSGLTAHAKIAGEGVRIDEFIAAYGIHGGTMTGLLRYDLDVRYGEGRLAADGRFDVPDGGTVTIELLDRLLAWSDADPTGFVKRALGNVREFNYRAAVATVGTRETGIYVNMTLKGQRVLGIFPSHVDAINVIDMPVGALARQFPGL